MVPGSALGANFFSARVSDSASIPSSVAQQISIPINPSAISVSVSPAATTTIDQGQFVKLTPTVTNDPNNKGVTWSLAGTACSGNACGSLGSTTTEAVYTPPSSVSSALTVTVTATSIADTNQSYTSTVIVNPAPGITTTSLGTGTVGTSFSAQLSATGGTGTPNWIFPTLPSWLTANSSSGATITLSGTVPASATQPTPISVTVTDAVSGTVNKSFDITIYGASGGPLTIPTTSPLSNGRVGASYSATIGASGGTQPYTWTYSVLPDGLTSTPSNATTTAALAGTPTATGTAKVTVTVQDSTLPTALTAQTTLNITISPEACGTGNESILSGQYAFSLSGFKSSEYLAAVGSLTADGNGNITAGEVDSNGALGVQYGVIDTKASSYSVGSDNRGCATLVTSFGTFTTRFTLGSLSSGTATEGRMIEYETPASTNAYIATGRILQQTPSSYTAGLSGSYAFEESGVDRNKAALGAVGVITAGGSSFTTGEMDGNDAGIPSGAISGVTGSYASPDPNGRVTSFATWAAQPVSTVVLYMVSNSQALLMTMDDPAGNAVLSGEMDLQTGTFSNTSLNTNAAVYASGHSGAGNGDSVLGILSENITSNSLTLIGAEDDYTKTGTWGSMLSSCGYSVAQNGRVTISGSGACSANFAMYLTAANTGFLLVGAESPLVGSMERQTSTVFPTAGTFHGGTHAVVSQDQWTDLDLLTLNGNSVSMTYDNAGTIGQTAGGSAPLDTFTVNPDGTFTSVNNPGHILGVIISSTKFVTVDHVANQYPSILVFKQ